MYNGAAFLGPSIAGGVTGSLINLGGKLMEGQIQSALQEDQQQFAKEQSQNQIKYNIQQMRDMGLSPMMLFEHGNATGGGAGAGGQGRAPSINLGQQALGLVNAVGQILKEDAESDLKERKIDLQEKKEKRQSESDIIDEMLSLDKASYYRSQRQLNNQLFDIRNRNIYSHN